MGLTAVDADLVHDASDLDGGAEEHMLQKRMETGGWRKWGILLTPELEKNELDGSLEPSKRSSVSSYRQIYPGIGQAEITTAHRQACESEREQMHKGQRGRQRGKGKGRAK